MVSTLFFKGASVAITFAFAMKRWLKNILTCMERIKRAVCLFAKWVKQFFKQRIGEDKWNLSNG
jgi:hypothetical protein